MPGIPRNRLVQDGALGTQLEALLPVDHPLSVKGLPLWSTKILLHDPDMITKIHKSYVDSGADMLVTATYQASASTLEKYEHMDLAQCRNVWQTAVDAAAKAAELSPRRIYIAGSIGPYGAYLANGAEYSGEYGTVLEDELVAYHEPMANFYNECTDCDIVAFETIPNFSEVKAVMKLAGKLEKPFYLSLSCKSASLLADGTPLETIVKYVLGSLDGFQTPENFYALGCNCVPFENVEAFVELVNRVCDSESKPPVDLVVYPNLGFDNDMSDVSQYAFKSSSLLWGLAVEKWASFDNVKVIGGCCSTGPHEVAEIRRVVDQK